MSAVLTPSTAPRKTEEERIIDGIELLPPPSPELISKPFHLLKSFTKFSADFQD